MDNTKSNRAGSQDILIPLFEMLRFMVSVSLNVSLFYLIFTSLNRSELAWIK